MNKFTTKWASIRYEFDDGSTVESEGLLDFMTTCRAVRITVTDAAGASRVVKNKHGAIDL